MPCVKLSFFKKLYQSVLHIDSRHPDNTKALHGNSARISGDDICINQNFTQSLYSYVPSYPYLLLLLILNILVSLLYPVFALNENRIFYFLKFLSIFSFYACKTDRLLLKYQLLQVCCQDGRRNFYKEVQSWLDVLFVIRVLISESK